MFGPSVVYRALKLLGDERNRLASIIVTNCQADKWMAPVGKICGWLSTSYSLSIRARRPSNPVPIDVAMSIFEGQLLRERRVPRRGRHYIRGWLDPCLPCAGLKKDCAESGCAST